MKATLFTQREVNLIFCHIPAKTLRWWHIRNLYQPACSKKDNRGTSRLYNLSNLYQIGVVEKLMELNLPIDLSKSIMDEALNPQAIDSRMREILEVEPLKGNFSIGDKESVLAILSWDKTSWTEPIILVSLAPIKDKIDRLIKEALNDQAQNP